MQTVAILGRQPALGLAELESIFGAERVRVAGPVAVVDAADTEFPMSRLGGTMKAGVLLARLPYTDWRKITEYLVTEVPKHTCCYGPGKLTFGLSAYGLHVSPKAMNATALGVKKVVRASGRPVRVVPNVETELNSAQVLHNNLHHRPLGMELLLIRDGTETLLAQTFDVQNIDAYAARDQKRPKRDARVGMLPPKLAQIIVNLATAGTAPQGRTLLDPFCGTGVVLQEADLMGFQVHGTDLEARMIDYSHENLKWLAQRSASGIHGLDDQEIMHLLAVGDATSFSWTPVPDFVACETYLGRPFSTAPRPDKLREVMQDVNLIHKKFLRNLARQTPPGFRACLAVPAWNTGTNRFEHLKVLDSLEELGYTRVSFTRVENQDLIYHRPGQIVARELVVVKRK